ncbi:MAG: PhoH family protein [Gammaproteobacteria bacterium]|jgi:phosphate starvation-inducible PhoH-like protein|tara:strand:- start:329 stop:1306 length:978 start_codon:yes stop_codon:yes gene_type:complete
MKSPQNNFNQNIIKLEPIDNDRLANLCGLLDKNIRQIEIFFDVEISNRGNSFKITGDNENVASTSNFIERMYDLSGNEEITPKQLHLYLNNSGELLSHDYENETKHNIKLKKIIIKPKSINQKKFIDTINKNTITFGIGAAGTGKTFLAVASAVYALENGHVKKIILVRPAIEAGEKLGFLPGDLAEKIDPYLQPLYDSLYECLGFDNVNKLLEKNIIEIAPLAYMRGRTLNDAFIILDEAQNTTISQMQMFLTRIGYGSSTVVTGDVSQIDLPRESSSGLKDCLEFILKIKGIDAVNFEPKDVMRHKIVTSIITEYGKRKKNKD